MAADTNEALTIKLDNVNQSFTEYKRESREHNSKVDLKLDEQTRMLQEINTSIPSRISAVEGKVDLVIEPKLLEQAIRIAKMEENFNSTNDYLTGIKATTRLIKWAISIVGVLNLGTLIAVAYFIREVTK
jgi:hypothetical protein